MLVTVAVLGGSVKKRNLGVRRMVRCPSLICRRVVRVNAKPGCVEGSN